jgi:hypothetical protein
LFQLVLIFCTLAGHPCSEQRPVFDPPLDLTSCMLGGQFTRAQLQARHPDLAETGFNWRCEPLAQSTKPELAAAPGQLATAPGRKHARVAARNAHSAHRWLRACLRASRHREIAGAHPTHRFQHSLRWRQAGLR